MLPWVPRVVLGATLLLSVPCMAQSHRTRSFGIDVGMRRTPYTSSRIGMPVDRFRMGIPLSGSLSLEPTLSFIDVLGIDGMALPVIGDPAELGLGLVARMDAELFGARPYLRPAVGLVRGQRAAVGVDAGLGLGLSVTRGDRYDVRAELASTRSFGGFEGVGAVHHQLLLGMTYYRR